MEEKTPTEEPTEDTPKTVTFAEATSDASAQGNETRRRRRATKHRQWLYDRCNGQSRYKAHGRPPCPICYVPVFVKWFPDLIEQNPMLEYFGRIGCIDPESPSKRRVIFKFALLSNLIGMILTFFACFSISTNYTLLRGAAFTKGTAQVFTHGQSFGEVTFNNGLRAVAMSSDPILGDVVLTFNEFCDRPLEYEGWDRFLPFDRCNSCRKASTRLISSCIMSLVFYLPSITTDFLRMYPNYDVNCQKFFGAMVGFISTITSLYTWFGYQRECAEGFYHGEVHLAEDFTVAETEEETVTVLFFDWRAGYGLLCIVAATLLKVFDFGLNFAVPTPSITRNHNEQEAYERLAMTGAETREFELVHSIHREEEQFDRFHLSLIPSFDEERRSSSRLRTIQEPSLERSEI